MSASVRPILANSLPVMQKDITINDDHVDLVRRAQNGEEAALSILYERYFDRVYRYVLSKVGNMADAEDLAEEVFVRMLKSIRSFKWQGVNFSSWLFRIAHNLVIDHLRRQSYHRAKMPILAVEASSEGRTPAEEAERRWAYGELAEAVKKLPPAQRDVITLRFAAELSVAEAASALGKREGTVKVLQHNALASLRRLLGDRP